MFVTDTSLKAFDNGNLVALETGDFALRDALEEALQSSAKCWNEWGRDSLDVKSGIEARIQALDHLR
jgi:hypothetical protein